MYNKNHMTKRMRMRNNQPLSINCYVDKDTNQVIGILDNQKTNHHLTDALEEVYYTAKVYNGTLYLYTDTQEQEYPPGEWGKALQEALNKGNTMEAEAINALIQYRRHVLPGIIMAHTI